MNGDQFAEIKLDSQSLQAAINDVMSGSIVLANDPAYQPHTCSYMIYDDGDSDDQIDLLMRT